MTPVVVLRRGRARPAWAGHPRILSGAVERVEGSVREGSEVIVADHDGRAIGRGIHEEQGPVRVHLLTLDPEEAIDEGFFGRRVERAARERGVLGLPSAETDAYRLLHGSGDGLPGVAADRYGAHAVVRISIPGLVPFRRALADAIRASFGVEGVLYRPEEGGGEDLAGTPVPEEVDVRENGILFTVEPRRGQKTGHYTDQRPNRATVGRLVAGTGARRVLDAFCGTGGFGLAAAKAGAEAVLGVDSSAPALSRARQNARANGLGDRFEFVRDDVFRALRRAERAGERYDVVILDPPRLASGRKALRRALRGYKELNLRALRMLSEGGVLATASCTGTVSEEDFTRTVRDAALDAGRTLSILHRGGQGPDHPWVVAAPEGRYLDFLAGRVR